MKRMAYLPLALLCLLLLPGLSAAQDVQSYIDQGIKHSQSGRYDQALGHFLQCADSGDPMQSELRKRSHAFIAQIYKLHGRKDLYEKHIRSANQ